MVKFYYNRELIDIHKIMNDFVDKAMVAGNTKSQLKNDFLPSLLSKFTGIKCPANYNTVIDDNII